MSDRDVTGRILVILAALLLLAGFAAGDRALFAASLLVAIAAAGVLVFGPSPEQRAARGRNQARRIR